MSYSSEVLADSPVAYYRLDSVTGRTVDSSGNSRTLTEVGTNFTNRPSLLTSDTSDGACEFADGTATGYLTRADSSPFAFTGTASFTVECWLNPTSPTTDFKHIIGWSDDSDTGTNAYMIFCRSGSGLAFVRRAAGVDKGTYVNPTTLDATHHIVGVYDGTNVRTYVDGSNHVSANEASGSQGAYAGTIRIGAAEFGAGSLPGILDEVAIYSGVLSTTRIDAHYQAGIAAIVSGQGPRNLLTLGVG